MLFWCFRGGDSVIFDKMNSEFSWEYFIGFFYCSELIVCVWWEEKGRQLMIIVGERFVFRTYIVCWLIFSEGGTNVIPPFLNLKESVTFNGHGRQTFDELWRIWRFFMGFKMWPFDDIRRMLFIGWRRFVWSEIWYFHIEGFECLCFVRWDLIKFYINYCFNFWLWYFNIGDYLISGAHFL